ncbi:uncharacterized protein LOC121870642 [Homarus americanus]|uniref:uncharacterized protein LOC121870642 n=1 Tax=Homarus americanus TaxID=6706 RepID=UPI001C43EA46|nr:uncharacterized protein LOC121870642 [Homarus americanus]
MRSLWRPALCRQAMSQCKIARIRQDKKLTYKEVLLAVHSQEKKKQETKKQEIKKKEEKREKKQDTKNHEVIKKPDNVDPEPHLIRITSSDFLNIYERHGHEEEQEQEQYTHEWTVQEKKKRRGREHLRL